MSFVKGLLGFIGRTLIGLGLTLFIFSFFMGYALSDIEILEITLVDVLVENVEDMEGYDSLKEFCDDNPSDEVCDIINNPGQVLNESGFNQFINEISSYNSYVNLLRWSSVLIFIIGFGLIYLNLKSFILTLYKVGFNSTITSALAIFYYRYLPVILDKILISDQFSGLVEGGSGEALSVVSNIINNWLYFPLQKTYTLAILITAVFLVITVVIYFIKKKGLYKQIKEK